MIGCQAALFAGFLSAFLIELLGRLEPDPLDIIQDVLIYQTQMIRNSSLGPYVPPDFSPPEYIVLVNALFYASLGVMILAAFIAMLIKSWVREFDRGLGGMTLSEQRAKTREFRYFGMERWKLPEMVGILPLLIQISLFLFSIGLLIFLFHISTPSFGVTTAIFCIGLLYYGMTTSISVFVTSSPFRSPLSRTLSTVYRCAHEYVCPIDWYFMGPDMDSTPATVLGRIRRFIQISLHKSRPYEETEFEDPIDIEPVHEILLSMAIVDKILLSTVASALQRIHDSVPDSQNNEALQRSVWEVAGNPTLNIPVSFCLPYWVPFGAGHEERFSHLPPAVLVALLVVSLRGPLKPQVEQMTTQRNLLQRMDISNDPWAQVVVAAFDYLNNGFEDGDSRDIEQLRQAESNLTRVTRRKDLSWKESYWLICTLSEHRSEEWQPEREPFLIEICLAILSHDALRWDNAECPSLILLEPVVTLAAMSCSPESANRSHILNSSRERPFLLRNVRKPTLFANWFEDTPSEYHKQLISLLLLVTYVFILRGSYPVADQYLMIIIAQGNLPLYTSALTAVAPAMRENILSAISRMLVVPRPQELTPTVRYSILHGERVFLEELLQNYDLQLGAAEDPDANFFAIVFMLSKHVPPGTIERLVDVNVELENPWLRLAARVAARLDVSDESGLPVGWFYDRRVHNMIAALSLLRYTRGTVSQYTEFLRLESFLESQELSISSVALEYYMKTAISYPSPRAPSYCLSAAVSAAFNFVILDHPLWMGWSILDTFVDGFETLSVEWRRSFAEGFFTLSRRPLLTPRGKTKPRTRDGELMEILTWEYFHEKGQELEWTDSEFSGLDWMARAWSLHLSQQSGRNTESSGQGEGKSGNLSRPTVNEEFVLRALCKLLDAAPAYQLITIIPKLSEFVQRFDDSELPEYRRMISTRIREATRMHEEFQKLHCFDRFHCMWYI